MQHLLHALMPRGVREQKHLVAQVGVVGDEETAPVQEKTIVDGAMAPTAHRPPVAGVAAGRPPRSP